MAAPIPWNSAEIDQRLRAQRSAAPELILPLDAALALMQDRYGINPGTAPAPVRQAGSGSGPRTP